jgi:quinol monooxygenase YgiN
MIHVLAFIQVREGHLDDFLTVFKANVPNVLAEAGCVEYVPTLDVPTGIPIQDQNPAVITVVEKWNTLADLEAHLTAPHMRDYQEKVKDWVASVSIKVLSEA